MCDLLNENYLQNMKNEAPNFLREKEFRIEQLDFYFQEIIFKFKESFKSFGYKEYRPVSLISEIDHSVRFIGSTINVFKKYLLKFGGLNDKYFLIQKCLRTRNSKTFFNDLIFPEWSSYFIALGTISPPEDLIKTLDGTIDFLFKLGIKNNQIRINIYYQDGDLLKCITNSCLVNNLLINIDTTENPSSYRHKYGLDKIYGRNFNIAIKNQRTEEFKDIGNITLIENTCGQLAVEVAMGVSTLISRIFGLSNSIESSIISKIVPFKEGFTSKFSDALSATVMMLKQKIKSKDRGRYYLLRIYVLALLYLGDKVNFSFEEIKIFAQNYEKEEFGIISDIGDKLITYMEKYNQK